jgi:hypothetical protein
LIFGYLWRLFRQGEKLPKVIAYSFLLIFFLMSTITAHISLPHQGAQAKRVFVEKGIPSNSQIGFIGNLHAGSKIRMSLGPKFNLMDLPRENWENEIADYTYLILEDKHLSQIDTGNYEVTLLAKNWESRQISKLLISYESQQFAQLLEENSKKYFLLKKK